MSRFDEALHIILRFEGGYVNDPEDPGGETNHGITIAVARANGYMGDMLDIPDDVVRDIYRFGYWDACQCDRIPWPLSALVFDSAVNQGATAAIKMLQRTLGVVDDGVIGQKTLAAVENANPDINARFMTERAIRYISSKGFPRYGHGWLNRVFELALTV